MKSWTRLLVAGLLGFWATSCAGKDGEDGSSCSIEKNDDGSGTLTCDDGTEVTLSPGEDGDPGEDGQSCTVEQDGDGQVTIACGEDTATVSDGESGLCTVADDGNGLATLSCDDGSSVKLTTCALGSYRCAEDALQECTDQGWNEVEVCEPGECQAGEQRCGPEEGALRLAGGVDELQGRVEIYHNGRWGTVCDDLFADDSNAANVVCRQLGYSSGEPECCGFLGAGSGFILMDEVDCDGSEDRLLQCMFPGWGVTNCAHSEDVGVVCTE